MRRPSNSVEEAIKTKEQTMSKVCQISSQLIVLAGTIALVVTGFSTVVSADTEVDAAVVVVVSDDIMDRTTNIGRAGDGAGDGAGSGNNGHGNNEDGVDSSNPGEGGGGPNGGVDPSGDVDDEAGGGGAAPSKNKNK
jgi:hypothetical protein